MHLQIPHKTSQQDALSRVKQGVEQMRSQMGDKVEVHEERWEESTLHFDATAQGQRVSGTLAVDDKEFVIDAKLPLMLRLFEGRIEKEIMAKVSELG